MSVKLPKPALRAARLVALVTAIEDGLFDPETVNEADLARLLGVHRGQIMRDLRLAEDITELSQQLSKSLVQNPPSESKRKGIL